MTDDDDDKTICKRCHGEGSYEWICGDEGGTDFCDCESGRQAEWDAEESKVDRYLEMLEGSREWHA